MDIQNGQQNNIEKYRVDGMSLKEKSDKIVIALHMVTDCIEDNEPIRFKIRTLGIELVSSTHMIIHTPAHERGFIFSDVELIATEIFSFLRLAKSIRLISDMNADILLRELSTNIERMRAWVETGFYETDAPTTTGGATANFTLNETHFKIADQRDNSTAQAMTSHKGLQISKGQTTTPSSHAVGNLKESKVQEKEDQTNSRKFDFAVKLTRRNTILKIIKDKKEVSVKDISGIIVDCSEKTIQRELIVLVGEGVLKKIGHKRWSKYAIA